LSFRRENHSRLERICSRLDTHRPENPHLEIRIIQETPFSGGVLGAEVSGRTSEPRGSNAFRLVPAARSMISSGFLF
jgi:hypothetical protein